MSTDMLTLVLYLTVLTYLNWKLGLFERCKTAVATIVQSVVAVRVRRQIQQVERCYLEFEAVLVECREHLETMPLGQERRVYGSKIDRVDDRARKECVSVIEFLEKKMSF